MSSMYKSACMITFKKVIFNPVEHFKIVFFRVYPKNVKNDLSSEKSVHLICHISILK